MELKNTAVKKGKKFLVGHSYASGLGYKYSWSFNKDEARKMTKDMAEGFAMRTNGRLVHIPPGYKPVDQYLSDNNISVETGLQFTYNDYKFIIISNLDEIIINKDKVGREEVLTKSQIVERIHFLYDMHLKNPIGKINEDLILELLNNEGIYPQY